MYGLAAIINVTGLLFAAGVALRFRSLQATPLMQVPVFLFLFLAPVYVPRELLGGWVHAVAPFNPATHVMETVRDLIAGQGSDYLATLGVIVALLAVVTIFMFRGLRQAEAAGCRVRVRDNRPAASRASRITPPNVPEYPSQRTFRYVHPLLRPKIRRSARRFAPLLTSRPQRLRLPATQR